jgi:hypothetical protein
MARSLFFCVTLDTHKNDSLCQNQITTTYFLSKHIFFVDVKIEGENS